MQQSRDPEGVRLRHQDKQLARAPASACRMIAQLHAKSHHAPDHCWLLSVSASREWENFHLMMHLWGLSWGRAVAAPQKAHQVLSTLACLSP